jgi:stage II sporulation protein D
VLPGTRALCVLAAAAAALGALPVAHAAPVPTPTPPRAAERLILRAAAGTVLTVEGKYPRSKDACPAKPTPPLRAKYRGRVEIVRAPNGRIDIVNEVSFGEYLRGLAEVPPSWPPAALRAQSIAARSYAFNELRHPPSSARRRGYDICASDQCQVYRGAAVELGAFGDRWAAAVDATAGQVLSYGGSPIQAFYFSTSDGRTRRSFPGGAPKPWLPSVAGEDSDAPLARWTARIPLADLTAIMRDRGDWSGGAISSVSMNGDTVTMRASGGTAPRDVTRSEFRLALNNSGPCMFPDRYPTKGAADGGKLPQTIPSQTFSLATSGADVVARGRGWGHGVGMSQWGARSLAARGRGTASILRHYYGPATIERVTEPPAIRVLAAEGLARVFVRTPAGARATDAAGSDIAPGDRFEIRGGATLRILRDRSSHIAPVLQVTLAAAAPLSAQPGASIALPFELNRSANVSVEIARGTEVVARADKGPFVSGPQEATVPLRGADGTALAPGDYTATVLASDALDSVRSVPLAVVVAAPPPSPRAAARSSLPRYLSLGAAALALAALAFAYLRRRGRHAASRT